MKGREAHWADADDAQDVAERESLLPGLSLGETDEASVMIGTTRITYVPRPAQDQIRV